MIPIKRFLLGVDLAKSFDFTSLAVIEMDRPAGTREAVYHLRALDRIRGVDYPVITQLLLTTIKHLEKEPETKDGPHLCLDASGLGAPIRDYLREDPLFHSYGGLTGKIIYPVIFTGGESARRDPATGNYNISKSLIIGNFLSLMQHRRFDYAPDLQALPLLEEEISAFKRHTTSSGKTGFDAVAGAHDDLICAVCVPLIVAELVYKNEQTGPLVVAGETKTPINGPGNPAIPQWVSQEYRAKHPEEIAMINRLNNEKWR